MYITDLFEKWPERAIISVRLELTDMSDNHPDSGGYYRLCLKKLGKVFEMAKKFGIQQRIETNLNRLNATYIYLNNYVLRNRNHKSANPKGWGDHYGFLLALAKEFPNDVFIDEQEGELDRYVIDDTGNIIETIDTWDAV